MDRIRFGRAVVALRKRHGWTQDGLAALCRLSRSVVGRAERGEIARIAFGDLEAITRTLDGRLGLDFWWRGDALDRLIDERHAALVDAVVRLFEENGWKVAVEVTFSIYGERGSIDVFAYDSSTGLVAVVEVKATIGEAGATLIGLDRKARLAPKIARDRGWACTGVAVFLAVADGSTSRDRIARHADAFRRALPDGSVASRRFIRAPKRPAPRGIVYIHPRKVRPAAKRRA